MSLWETFILALKSISSSKMRTFLTMLGIIIGVTAVIVIVGLGNGMQKYMTDSFASMGLNTLTVTVTGRGTARSVSADDMYEIVEEHSQYLETVSPTVSIRNTIKKGTETLDTTGATGVSEDYFDMSGYELARGRSLQYIDILDRRNVCVVGAYVARTYYNGNAVGQDIRIGTTKLTIVGVLAQKGETLQESSSDDKIFLPYTTAARLTGLARVGTYTFTIKDEEHAAEAKKAVEDELYEVFRTANAYSVISMSEMLDTMNSMINVVITVLAFIAGISLLVGGIGIMNIMLVSVTERTREIGIRKALGAKEGTILRQFVIEAATTSGLGGMMGIALGYLLSGVATKVVTAMLETTLTVSPSAGAVMMAFGISAFIGVLFGYLPARKAAKLNPIDALRYE